MSIVVNNLSKIYGEQKAVNNISFEIKNGEIVGFLGPNGAGKSTTMKMITGFLKPSNGTISVCDVNVLENNIEAKQKIGYLPESNALYYDMYVREYLEFIANIHQLKNLKNEIEDAIQLVGLNKEANKKIGELSKGYKQRVGLAASLIHNPDVLILDEPTSGLDPNQIIEIRNVIKKLGVNKTILFSSHILQEVEALCDRVIIINKGEIVANNLLSNLQNNKNQIIEVQFKEVADIKDLEKLEHIKSVEKNNLFYTINCTNTELAKKEILQYALNKDLNIISLQTQTQSLEVLFKELTK